MAVEQDVEDGAHLFALFWLGSLCDPNMILFVHKLCIGTNLNYLAQSSGCANTNCTHRRIMSRRCHGTVGVGGSAAEEVRITRSAFVECAQPQVIRLGYYYYNYYCYQSSTNIRIIKQLIGTQLNTANCGVNVNGNMLNSGAQQLS